jgi:hypothetical protein
MAAMAAMAARVWERAGEPEKERARGGGSVVALLGGSRGSPRQRDGKQEVASGCPGAARHLLEVEDNPDRLGPPVRFCYFQTVFFLFLLF